MRKLTKAFSALLVVVMLMSVVLCAPFSVSAASDVEKDYYLSGVINGVDYADNEDYLNMGEYKFVNGKLTVVFTEESYVDVKETDNANWYMTDGWLGTETTKAVLYNTKDLSDTANRLFVPVGAVTFTLTNNDDGTLTLSYVVDPDWTLTLKSITAVGNGDGNWLNGSAWDPSCEKNHMTEVSEDIYEITFYGLEKFSNYSFKFAVNDSWRHNWGGSFKGFGVETDAEYGRNEISFALSDESADVTIRLDLSKFDYYTKLGAKFTVLLSNRFNRQVEPLCNNRLTVYQNDNGRYKASADAKIRYNGKEYQTNSFGTANLPSIDSGSITVSKDGYIARTLTAQQLKNSKIIYLEEKNDNAPVITAVWIDNTNVLHDSYPLDMASKNKTTIKAEVDWGNYSYGSIKLYQDGKTADFRGNSLSMVISDKFDTSNTINLIATDSQNHTAEKALRIQNKTVNKVLENLNGASFDFNDSISLTLPDSTPLIGGMKVGAGLSSAVPIEITAENGKVYVSIGAQFFSASKEGTNFKNAKTQKVKGFINNFKETFKDNKNAVSKLKKFKNTYKNDLKKPKGKFGVEADFTVIGFAEGTFDSSGKVTWIDTGMIMNPSVSVSKDIPFSIGPVPLYFEVGVSADVLGQLNLRLNEQAKKFVPNGEISGTLSLNGGVGVGVKKVLYAGGGLEGSLMPDWKINVGSKDYFKLKAKLKAYAKAGIACFEAKKTWDLAEKTLVEYPSKKLLNSSGGILDDYDFYDASNYKVKNLSYLDNNSSFMGNLNPKKFLTSSTYDDNYVYSTQLKTNIYKESTPQYVVFEDGTKLAVWLDSDSSNINDVCLYYSYFNGNSWSTPEKVYNDGTVDYAPDIVECSGKVYLVWQNATRTFDDNAELTLDDIAKDFDISVAVFDENHQFTTKTFENNNLDMQPVVCANGDNAYIAWINNGQNDWFGDNGDNSILISSYSNGSWSEPEVIYNNLNSLDSIEIDYNEGINVAYCMDTDGDINTTEDLKVYENGTVVSDESQSANSPQYCNHKLFWYSNNNIISSDIASNGSGNIVSDRYQIIDVNGTTAVVFCQGDGLYSKLNVSYLNTETNTWGNPRTLVDNNTFIGSFSVAVNNLGNIEVLVNSCNVTGSYEDEDPYGTATLMLYNEADNCDLSISELLYDESTFCADNSMNFDFSLTNEGSTVINGTNVIIKDESGKVLSTTYIEDTIVPGETIESSASYIVNAKYTSQKVSVYAEPTNGTDVDLTDNTQDVVLSYENICVENLTSAVMENGNIAISADIVNYGYQNAEKICVKLIKDSIDGNVVAIKTIDNINSLDLQTLSFEVNDNSKSTYFISIDGDADDYTADNSDFILINSDITYDIGDVNQDGNVDIKDATLIQFYVSTLKELNSEQLALADTNSDGEVTIADATLIQKFLAGLVTELG